MTGVSIFLIGPQFDMSAMVGRDCSTNSMSLKRETYFNGLGVCDYISEMFTLGF